MLVTATECHEQGDLSALAFAAGKLKLPCRLKDSTPLWDCVPASDIRKGPALLRPRLQVVQLVLVRLQLHARLLGSLP